ncbi:hypothetical protein, partial [Pasteurella atlantica]
NGQQTDLNMDYKNSDDKDYSTVATFNDKGEKATYSVDYKDNDHNDYTASYTYNEQGFNTSIIQEYVENTSRNFTVNKEYNEAGQEVKYTIDHPQNHASDYTATSIYDEQGLQIKRVVDYVENDSRDFTATFEYDNQNEMVKQFVDMESNGGVDKLYVYEPTTISNSNNILGTTFKDIYILEDDVAINIADTVLDVIANDQNGHKVYVNSTKTGDVINLEGNFVKAETESHAGQDYVKYTDEAGNALIIDPDITVNII